MANTEGLTDEALHSLLSMPSPEEEKQQRSSRSYQNAAAPAGRSKPKGPSFPRRSLTRREQMMELGEGETPAAMVIRSSKAPKIHSASAKKKGNEKSHLAEKDDPNVHASSSTAEQANVPHVNDVEEPSDNHTNKANDHRPVILSECIRERPVDDIMNSGRNASQSTSATGAKSRVSRFKQRNHINNGVESPTAGGFPSLDIAPVGAFTRRGRSALVRESPTALDRRSESQSNPPTVATKSTASRPMSNLNAGKDVEKASRAMLANMSVEEIRDSVEEVQSILSAQSIEFLRKRGLQKQAKSKASSVRGAPRHNEHDFRGKGTPPAEAHSSLTKLQEIELEQKKAQEEKEKMAELLSSVRTPEDMDRVYNEALKLGLAAELPSSSLDAIANENDRGEGMTEQQKNLHIATSLLRSTAPRQRLLGVRSLCGILEEDMNELVQRRHANSFSASCDERESIQKKYPQLLPVALRCLLDESIATFQTAGGRMLLSSILRCIHALMTLFVHPYHVVNVSPASTCCDDPFILHQTCFMNDISHVPPGTEVYPPTQIRPLDQGDAKNASCYRADSSAASAESDSKAFYNDPAWTLLSRMRILPCLSDILLCLSTDYSTGMAISEETIQSICGILAMLAVRSPGAAGAIARHKGILPFLISYCLSPSNGTAMKESNQSKNKDSSDDKCGIFNTGAALPLLILLCTLVRQSKGIAELVPFQSMIPDLQAILCVEAENDEELGIQIWSLVLLRILMRYGCAVEHVQALINIAAPRIELMRPESSIGAHSLLLFANICDASKTMNQKENGQAMSTISEGDDGLAMAGVWLSSSARRCVASFQTLVEGCGKSHMKLASAQLRLLESYISTALPTMTASSIPIVPKESCVEVIVAGLESDMLENALAIALGASFNAYWDSFNQAQGYSLEEEAAGCSFVISFMHFVKVVGVNELGIDLKMKLYSKIVDSLNELNKRKFSSQTISFGSVHPARQAWFTEAEFSVLTILCEENSGLDESERPLLSTFAFSLLGRLTLGHEAMAAFIFRQKKVFKVLKSMDQTETSTQSLQILFLMELSMNDRKLQLNHSSNIYFMHDLCHGSNSGSLNSLRCTADFVGSSDKGQEGERFVLPLGGIWMWNVLSSTISQPDGLPETTGGGQNDDALLDIVSHNLHLLLQLEMALNESYYTSSINNGTKLYHIANVCLFPENVLSNDFVSLALDMLFKQFSGFGRNATFDSSLVKDFIKACFNHSRISKESKKYSSNDEAKGTTEKKLHELLHSNQTSPDGYSEDELKALGDFVDDLCDAYIEFGGQYAIFTNFMRIFLGHGFPAKITTAVLTKLHPILHVLTIEEEERNALSFSLIQSISGGLPSLDSSRRDPSSVLDSFSSSLKKRDKELVRSDYVYLLSVAVLSRNLASSCQRCECGLQAMKNRLSGMSDAAFNDIIQVCKKLLCSEIGTKDVVITSVLNVCIDGNMDITEQFGADSWDRAVSFLKG